MESIKIHKIKQVLKQYLEFNDDGTPNKEYDGTLTAEDTIDKIHKIVGEI